MCSLYNVLLYFVGWLCVLLFLAIGVVICLCSGDCGCLLVVLFSCRRWVDCLQFCAFRVIAGDLFGCCYGCLCIAVWWLWFDCCVRCW